MYFIMRRSRLWRPQITIPVFTLAAGILIGWGFAERMEAPTNIVTDSAVRITGKYKLVSPLLVCSSAQASDYDPDLALQNKIEAQIRAAEGAGQATDVSVYFRGFSGHWVGVNDDDQYAPASLLKVPIMIAYFKESENVPGLLSKQLTYDGSTDANSAEVFKSAYDLKPGTYTISQLIQAMIEYSDNNAAMLLYNNMDPAWLSEVYTDLGLSVQPGGTATAEDITAKQYSYFFRILYNATYLTPEDSETALEYLTNSDFPQGIQSSVPQNTPVASKFGERTVLDTSGNVVERELHDCGLIYLGSKNYVVCIMTKGKDFNALTSVIQSISKTVYDAVVSTN